MSALGRCVAIPAERFADEHWGRLPLLTRRGELAAGFDDLLDASAVDELVSRRGLRTPFLRMAKGGDLVAPKRYTRGGGAGAGAPDQVADDRVLDQLGSGATLVLQGLHRTWPPLPNRSAPRRRPRRPSTALPRNLPASPCLLQRASCNARLRAPRSVPASDRGAESLRLAAAPPGRDGDRSRTAPARRPPRRPPQTARAGSCR